MRLVIWDPPCPLWRHSNGNNVSNNPLPMCLRVASLAPGEFWDWAGASEVTLMDMGKIFRMPTCCVILTWKTCCVILTSPERRGVSDHQQFDCFYFLVQANNKENIYTPHNWPSARGSQWRPVDSPHNRQWGETGSWRRCLTYGRDVVSYCSLCFCNLCRPDWPFDSIKSPLNAVKKCADLWTLADI